MGGKPYPREKEGVGSRGSGRETDQKKNEGSG
jgi:hypothetical protein